MANGARLVLDGSGRKIAYARLRVVDAAGTALTARLEVTTAARLAVLVEDAAAIYPVRIDPTFSDADWFSLDGISGANNYIYAMVVDGSGNLFIGGNFTRAGGNSANYVAKWNGSAWSPLGLGLNSVVYAQVVSGTDLYVGGNFTKAGGKLAAHVARANIGVTPVFTSIALNPLGTQVLLTFTSDPIASFYLLSSTNLTTWQTNSTVNATGATNSVSVNLTKPQEFFRLRRLP